MSNEWDAYAGDWDADGDVVQYSEKAFDSLLKILSPDTLNILDFGCGTGRLTEKLAPRAARVVGLDTSPAMLTVLKDKSLANVETVGDVLSRETISGHEALRSGFDLITASSVCSFLPDYGKTVQLLRSLLAPGGWFVQWDWLSTTSDSPGELTEQTILDTLTQAGLEGVSVTTPFTMTMPDEEMTVVMGVGRNP